MGQAPALDEVSADVRSYAGDRRVDFHALGLLYQKCIDIPVGGGAILCLLAGAQQDQRRSGDSMITVRFMYITGIKRALFRDARLSGTWNSWGDIPMREIVAEDGCPAFEVTVNFDDA